MSGSMLVDCTPATEENVRVATHDRRGRTQRSTRDEHLPDQRAVWRHRSRDYWQERAEHIAPEVGAYARARFDADDVLGMLRTVQTVVTHLELRLSGVLQSLDLRTRDGLVQPL
jgi:hypothetical protein